MRKAELQRYLNYDISNKEEFIKLHGEYEYNNTFDIQMKYKHKDLDCSTLDISNKEEAIKKWGNCIYAKALYAQNPEVRKNTLKAIKLAQLANRKYDKPHLNSDEYREYKLKKDKKLASQCYKCKCGSEILRKSLYSHKKTKKHIKWVNSQ